MKKKDYIFIYILILIELLILSNSSLIVKSIIKSSNMFFLKIFPSLFPTMLISMILIKNNVTYVIPLFIKKLFKKLFNFNYNVTDIFLMSMLCGTPSNAIFVNNYLKKGLISVKEAENLICITHFINPLFIINSVGMNLFNDKKIGILILILLYLSNFIKAFILRNNFNKKEKINRKIENTNIIQNIIESIKTTLFAIINIFAIVIIFSMLTSLIKEVFNLNNFFSFLINAILEMTGGIINLSSFNISLFYKIILAYYIVSFGGLCIWMQVMSSIENKNVNYKKYIIFRIL